MIVGTDSKDKITGSSEGEVLSGGSGKDVLKGGGGPDGFFFHNPDGFGKKEVDKVKDFDSEEGDSVLVDKDVFVLGSKIKLKVVTGKIIKKAATSKKDFIYDDRKVFYLIMKMAKRRMRKMVDYLRNSKVHQLDASDFTIV